MTEPSEWCLMEYVSVLAGAAAGAPTDRPAGVHPWPCALGRWIHDRVGPATRREMRTLAPLMVGLDGPDAAVRTVVVERLAHLGAQLHPGSTLFTRLLAGRDHPRRLVDLGALVVDVCRASAVLEPSARDEVLLDLLADVVTDVRAQGAAPAPSAPAPSAPAPSAPAPSGAARGYTRDLVEASA